MAQQQCERNKTILGVQYILICHTQHVICAQLKCNRFSIFDAWTRAKKKHTDDMNFGFGKDIYRTHTKGIMHIRHAS